MLTELLHAGWTRVKRNVQAPYVRVTFESELGENETLRVQAVYIHDLLLTGIIEATEKKAKDPLNSQEIYTVANFVKPIRKFELEVDDAFSFYAQSAGIGIFKEISHLGNHEARDSYDALVKQQRIIGRWGWSKGIAPEDVTKAWSAVELNGQDPYLSIENDYGQISMGGNPGENGFNKYFVFSTISHPNKTRKGLEWAGKAFSHIFPYEKLGLVEAAVPYNHFSRELNVVQMENAIRSMVTGDGTIPLITYIAGTDF